MVQGATGFGNFVRDGVTGFENFAKDVWSWATSSQNATAPAANSTIANNPPDSSPPPLPIHQEPSNTPPLGIADQGPTSLIFTPPPDLPISPPPSSIADLPPIDSLSFPSASDSLLPTTMYNQSQVPPQQVLDNQAEQDALLANQQQQIKDAIAPGRREREGCGPECSGSTGTRHHDEHAATDSGCYSQN